MPLDLFKRGERSTSISQPEHDQNLTGIENALNGLESQLGTISTTLTNLTNTITAKLGNVGEDSDPSFGGGLDGDNNDVHNLRARVAPKSTNFVANPAEASVYDIQAPANITMTLPSDLTAAPVGTGLELHVQNNIEVTVQSASGDVGRIVNFSGHRKVKGPNGYGFLRVIRAEEDETVWKLVGTTTETTTSPATPAEWLANPFTRTSPQHRPIGTGAIYTAITQSLNRIAGAGFNVNNGGGTNIFTIATGDPTRTVTADGSVGGNTGLPVSLKVPASVSIGGAVNDRTLILFDPVTLTCHQFYHWGTSVTSPTAGWYRPWDIRGLGLNVGSSASKKAALVGLNRGDELSTVGKAILHVNEATVNRFGNTAILSRTVMWPAFGKDGSADTGDNNLGELPYGALLAIPPSNRGGPTKANLNLSELGGRLYDQLMGFGLYLFDGTSSTNMVLRGDQDSSSGVQTDFKAEMNKLLPHMRWISNNAENQTASGGGTALVANDPND